MASSVSVARIFLGICITGIGVLHFVFPGINAIIWPLEMTASAQQNWIIYSGATVLTSAGLCIIAGRKVFIISLGLAIFFLLLFFFSHLPAFLAAPDTMSKIRYWTNLNKSLALCGGFLLLAAESMSTLRESRLERMVYKIAPLGKYLFAIMLFLFGLGHFISASALSTMVPEYIPFKKFWTIVGGIVLVGSAVSMFFNFQVKVTASVLAATLFVWLLTLHLYYAIRFPDWQRGENFIGALTCLAFCGIAVIIAQRDRERRRRKKNEMSGHIHA